MAMEPQFPADFDTELRAVEKAANLEHESVVAANTFADIKKIGGCSTLIIEPARSATR